MNASPALDIRSTHAKHDLPITASTLSSRQRQRHPEKHADSRCISMIRGHATRSATASALAEHVLFCSVDNLGDMLCTTPVVRAFRELHPDAFLAYVTHNAGYCRVLNGNPDLDLVLHREDLSLRGDTIIDDVWLRDLPLPAHDSFQFRRFDVQALQRADARIAEDHISIAFGAQHGVLPASLRPTLSLSADDRAAATRLAPRPYLVFGMHATTTIHSTTGAPMRKEWVLDRWLRLARHIHGWDAFDVVAVGAASDPLIRSRYWRNVYGLPIKVAAALLEGAACVVTVEGGLSHLCHAVDAPMVVIFSKVVAYPWAYPREATNCRAIYDDTLAISCNDVIDEIEAILANRGTRMEMLSASDHHRLVKS